MTYILCDITQHRYPCLEWATKMLEIFYGEVRILLGQISPTLWGCGFINQPAMKYCQPTGLLNTGSHGEGDVDMTSAWLCPSRGCYMLQVLTKDTNTTMSTTVTTIIGLSPPNKPVRCVRHIWLNCLTKQILTWTTYMENKTHKWGRDIKNTQVSTNEWGQETHLTFGESWMDQKVQA